MTDDLQLAAAEREVIRHDGMVMIADPYFIKGESQTCLNI